MLYRPCLTFFFGLVFSVALFGQTGTIQGVLTDPGGASIPSAKVSAVERAKSSSSERPSATQMDPSRFGHYRQPFTL